MKNKEKNFASAIIYVHNAEDNIEQFLKTIIEVMENNFEHSEIICVNDFSEDRSLEKIKAISNSASLTSISVINLSHFHGLEMAMSAGMDLAIGDFVFECDNTILDFVPDEIMKIYFRSLIGFDIVSASPDKPEALSSKVFYKVFKTFSNDKYEMSTESFRVLSRRVINRISDMNRNIPYRKVIYANSGLKIDNIKYNIVHVGGKGVRDIAKNYRFDLAIETLILFTDFGYRFSSFMTFLMMIISILTIIYATVIYLTSKPIEGWTTTIIFLSISFFALFVVLTIVIKYLKIILDLIFKKKYYSFESIEKLTK